LRAHGKRAQHLPVIRPQLGHRVVSVVRHPDVGAVEAHSSRIGAHGETSYRARQIPLQQRQLL
jgi:hypothetical protein